MNEQELAERCTVLAAEARVRLLRLLGKKALRCGDPAACDLSERCCTVAELAQGAGVSVPTASHHLKELRRAGLVRLQRRGRHAYYALHADGLRALAAALEGLAAPAAQSEEA